MRYPLFLFSILIVYLLFPTETQAARHTPEESWIAHPPLHIDRDAASAPTGYSPMQIRHAYGFDTLTVTGARQIIAIVDAFDAPTIAEDIATFIAQYGLQPMYGLPHTKKCSVKAGPHPCFQKISAEKTTPASDAGWALETSLDTEWAHVTAPDSDILLIETKNSSLTSLMHGVDRAARSGAHIVSMSWGGPEFQNELRYDKHFKKSGVTFLASSGDLGTGESYPASSPYVLSVGGTTLPLDALGRLSGKETAWQGSGGGVSAYETQPEYQASFDIQANGKRSGPDIAYNANPTTGVSVYDSLSYGSGTGGWYALGGTSAAAPQWAGIIATIDEKRPKPLSTNTLSQSFAYDSATVQGLFRDIRSGKNGNCGAHCKASTGYDFVTGLGSPIVDRLVPWLQTH